MLSVSKNQRKFFGLVRAIQKGESSPSKVSPEVRKVAKIMSPKNVEDFASTSEKGLPRKVKKEALDLLKSILSPSMLNEEITNSIAKEFTKTEVYDRYVSRFVGIPFSQKELEAVNNYTEVKPTKIEEKSLRYETSDQFNNNTTTVIKKLREGNQFSYTAFTKYSQTQKPEEPSQEKPQVVTPAGPQPEEVVVAKSNAFSEDIEGSKILSNFIRKLDL